MSSILFNVLRAQVRRHEQCHCHFCTQISVDRFFHWIFIWHLFIILIIFNQLTNNDTYIYYFKRRFKTRYVQLQMNEIQEGIELKSSQVCRRASGVVQWEMHPIPSSSLTKRGFGWRCKTIIYMYVCITQCKQMIGLNQTKQAKISDKISSKQYTKMGDKIKRKNFIYNEFKRDMYYVLNLCIMC